MRMYDIIDKKRHKEELSRQEIEFFVNGYTEGSIPDYQASALLMAICLNGMNDDETYFLTQAMVNTGSKLDLSSIDGIKIDKHSTGGVGDKTSLVLAPMMVAYDSAIKMPKASGRGLGHTGGTLDKLESIPGFRVTLSTEEIIEQVKQIHLCIVGQSDDIAPADKKLYALRDATCTVESIPLIASSIMCKKLADGTDIQLLDVKYGNGAFMKTVDDARTLAKTMIAIGRKAGKKTCAEITSMEQPLGYEIGNANEVIEAIETLKGNGPKDLLELCLDSGVTLLKLISPTVAPSDEVLRRNLEETITSGRAFDVFCSMVEKQGGDVAFVKDPSLFPKAKYNVPVLAPTRGYVNGMDTYDLGIQAMKLGAGREVKDDIIDHAAGITLKKKIGDKVGEGDVLAIIHSERPSTSEAVRAIASDFEIGVEPKQPSKLVEETLVDPSYYQNSGNYH